AGADRYVFAPGSGHDRIEDKGTALAEIDVVELAGIASTEVTLGRLYRGSDTVIFGLAGNAADSLTVIDALAGNGLSIEEYRFADGVIWTRANLLALLDNRAPVAGEDGFFSVVTGTDLTLLATDLLRNDFDADDDPLRIVSVDGSPHGSALLDGDGNIRFTANAGFTGPTTIRYTITDDRNGFAVGVINVAVRPVAQARDDDGFTVAEDGFLTIRVERLLSNDIDGDRMIVGQVFGAQGGTVSLASNGDISFTPSANYFGPASFVYAANTPEGGRAEAVVRITVTPVNGAPVAMPDTGFFTDEGRAFTLTAAALLANDLDIDGDALSLVSVQSSADLFVAINASGGVTVTPRDNFFGQASFGYTIADPSGATASSAVTVTVHPVNDAPIAVDDRFETTQSGDPIREDNPIIISRAQLIANDIDFDGDPLTLTGVRNAFGGKATLLDNQTVLFEPNADFFGEARFEYRIDDGQGGIDWGTATIVYQAVNDRPVARDDRYTDPALYILRGVQDTPLVIPILELLKNDYDVEGFAVTFQNATGGVNGDVVRVGDDLVFTPDPGYFGEATFGYSITDPEGDVDGGFVTLYFRPTSSAAPVAVADRIFVAEDIPTVIRLSTLLANDTDVDLDELQIIGWRPLNGLGDFFTFGPDAVGPLNGTLELNADGDLLFTPNIDATFSSGFVYLLTDNADGTVEGFVDIVILPSNDDPTAVEDTGFVT
ncbi:MAG TPA: Ig-like domain-containing protein, partial [Novosphingobium sp.]|nr:Ig-like domain-containing protein [Novosphingobium sp.]